jgi:hypothetical protein
MKIYLDRVPVKKKHFIGEFSANIYLWEKKLNIFVGNTIIALLKKKLYVDYFLRFI